jgi:repressor LexA
VTRPRLTPAQRKIVEAILESKVTRGYPPTVREIAEATGTSSPSTVHHHLDVLERIGWITRSPNKPRTIVVDQPEEHDEEPAQEPPAPT